MPIPLSPATLRRLERRELRFNPNHDAKGQFATGGDGGAHAVGVSADPNSQSLHTLTGPQQPGETAEQYNARVFAQGLEHYTPAPNIEAEAHDIRAERGLPDPQVTDWTSVANPIDRTQEIGKAFAEAQSNPDDSAVQAAYRDLVDQTNTQWEHLTGPIEEGGQGIKVDFVSPEDIMANYGDKEGLNPYPTAAAQRDDIMNNGHLAIASISDYPEAYHPLLSNTRGGEYDTFRAVHDAYGHAAIGADFTRHGEYEAWVHHVSMFDGPARIAASTELRGENSFLVTTHEPAEHKAALLPLDLIQPPFDPQTGELRSAFRRWQRRDRHMAVGGEQEWLDKFGVINSASALLGKIAQQRKHQAPNRLRFNQNHGADGKFSSGDSANSTLAGQLSSWSEQFPKGTTVYRAMSRDDLARVQKQGVLDSSYDGGGVWGSKDTHGMLGYLDTNNEIVIAYEVHPDERQGVGPRTGYVLVSSVPADRILGVFDPAGATRSNANHDEHVRYNHSHDEHGKFAPGSTAPATIDADIHQYITTSVMSASLRAAAEESTDHPPEGTTLYRGIVVDGDQASKFLQQYREAQTTQKQLGHDVTLPTSSWSTSEQVGQEFADEATNPVYEVLGAGGTKFDNPTGVLFQIKSDGVPPTGISLERYAPDSEYADQKEWIIGKGDYAVSSIQRSGLPPSLAAIVTLRNFR